ncbi:polyphosphate polymerase domain-containing protein [Paenibacillus sp. 1001270B_150601_E10]|uniref:polyphosphate polymerase domain-containing protein n=1 Tax=Paenibacillus sp. 1001270B_150601_E10 TaxID=2787079 RepID=UPI0018A0FD35|nr:polyphosphate polymerase domain-containing protein [Paenibacillus sp. 1001270B_150601_E10]
MQPSLTYRNELKFFINHHQYLTIQKRLKHLVPQDKHVGPTGEYHIRSLYFDDINNTALHEKLGGIRDRAKYRIRIYNKQDQIIHFEKKIKFKDYIAKVKEPLTREMHDQIMAGHYDILRCPDRPLLMEIHQEITQRLLRPKVIVDYVREPFICENGNVRITFDKELRTGLHNVNLFDPKLETIRALDHNLIILEVKYDQYLPAYIQAALQLEGLNRQSASKYVICRKYLKTNTWEDY